MGLAGLLHFLFPCIRPPQTNNDAYFLWALWVVLLFHVVWLEPLTQDSAGARLGMECPGWPGILWASLPVASSLGGLAQGLSRGAAEF